MGCGKEDMVQEDKGNSTGKRKNRGSVSGSNTVKRGRGRPKEGRKSVLYARISDDNKGFMSELEEKGYSMSDATDKIITWFRLMNGEKVIFP